MGYRPSKKIRELKRRKIMKKYFFHYFSPVFFFLAFLFLIYSIPFFQIHDIKIIGTKYVDQNLISQIVDEELTGRYFYLFDKNHILFYPEDKIKQKILDFNRRIKKVEIVYKNWWRDLEIQITERNEKYLYCQIMPSDDEKEKSENCFFLDKKGVIFNPFSENKTVKKEKNFIRFYGKINLEKFKEVGQIIQLLQNNNLVIKKIIIDDFGNYTLVVLGNTKILLTNDFELKKISNRLLTILSYKDFKIENKKFKNRINYINLMFGRKIYYCLDDVRCANNY